MNGVYINGSRPKSKKAIKEAVATGVPVRLEATALIGNEYDGLASAMPENVKHYFVGPCPFTSRKFYGYILRVGNKITVT